MKILVYLEPHPIRNRFESFGFIGRKFVAMLRDEYLGRPNSGYEPHEVRIQLGRHYSSLVDASPDLAPLFLGMTQEENDAIEALNRDWETDPEAIRSWVDLMRGEGEVSSLYQRILGRVHDEVYPFDVVVNWSTNGAVRRFCEERGIDNVSMELGCTRRPIYDSLYFDANGVNGLAISRHLDLSRVKPMNLDVLRMMLPTRADHDKAWDGLHNVIASRQADAIYQDVERNILIPLQLKDDSNCILYSRFGSMLEVLQEVLPRLTAAGYRCFVKPHPSADDRPINKADHEACRVYAESFEDGVFWLDDIQQDRDYPALLNKMPYVVTVNSSTGFEAMLYGKVVVPLGEAPYRIGHAFPTLDDLVGRQISLKTYREMSARIVTVLLRHYLAPNALGFDFAHFTRHLQRAIRARSLLLAEGPSAMTDYLLGEPYLDFDVRERILAKRELRSRFAKHKSRAEPAAPATAKPLPIRPTATGAPDAVARKWRKFRRDPAKFFVDSRNPVVKGIGRLLGGRA